MKLKRIEKIIFDNVLKDLRKIPFHIVKNFQRWIKLVEMYGIKEIRKMPGFHDEPLKGNRVGQRSIRLSKSYRAIYIEYEEEQIHILSVEEINKHDY
jgi:proteic killer suppression protein